MIKNVAGQKTGVQMITAADGTAFTGSVTVAVTVDAGTQATGSVGSGACAHKGGGYHTYAPAQAETNGDLIAFTYSGTGAVPQTVQVYTRPATPDVKLADAVTHGGSTAKLQLGSASSTPALLVENSGGDAFRATSSGGNGHGIASAGHGTGTGVRAAGGATGRGIHGLGGATSGHGMHVEGTTLGHGLLVEGRGANPDPGHALVARAVDTDGNGIYCKGIGDGDGLHAEGADAPGNGQGIVARAGAGADTAGMSCLGAGSHGGLEVHGGPDGGAGFVAGGNGVGGNGILAIAADTGNGFLAKGGGTAGHGIVAQAIADGAGLQVLGAGGGNAGLYAEGDSTDGPGIYAYGYGTGAGIQGEGDTGDGIRGKTWDMGADIKGNIDGNLSGSVGSVTGAVGSVTDPVTLHGDYDAAKTAASQTSVDDLPDDMVDALYTEAGTRFLPVDAHKQNFEVTAGELTTYEPDGTTPTAYSPKTVTTDPDAEPITGAS